MLGADLCRFPAPDVYVRSGEKACGEMGIEVYPPESGVPVIRGVFVLPADSPVRKFPRWNYGENGMIDSHCGVLDHAPGPDGLWHLYAARFRKGITGWDGYFE
jgi:hypothetical protein